MGILIFLISFVITSIVIRMVWWNGVAEGKRQEIALLLKVIDRLFVPNWQSLIIFDPSLSKEQLEAANRVYSAAYRVALDHIRVDIITNHQQVLVAQSEGSGDE